MAALNQAQQYFASLVELSRDTGLIGNILENYPQEFLRAADKWAEQNADYQTKKEDPNRLPLPDPWQFFIDAPAVPERDKSVFRAAQSQLPALRHLIHIVRGIATLNTDWYQEYVVAQASGNKTKRNHASSKIADAYVLNERIQEDMRKQNDPEILKQMERLLKKRRAQLIHHGDRAKIEQLKRLPSWNEFRKQNKLPVILVEWWVRSGVNGAPGLMFFRNEALMKFLTIHLDQSNLDPQAVKKTRQQLGLIPVGDKKHFVWDFSIIADKDGNHKIEGYRRNGKPCFSGLISSQKQISAAVMAAFSSL